MQKRRTGDHQSDSAGKMVDVSDMSTFEAIYNGIAEVENEADPTQIDYYVSYEAKVKAGFDLKI